MSIPPLTCENHGLTPEEHCTTMEEMLFEVPADIREGERSPSQCVKRLNLALEDAQRELGEANAVVNKAAALLRKLTVFTSPELRALKKALDKYSPGWEKS